MKRALTRLALAEWLEQAFDIAVLERLDCGCLRFGKRGKKAKWIVSCGKRDCLRYKWPKSCACGWNDKLTRATAAALMDGREEDAMRLRRERLEHSRECTDADN